MKKLFPFCKDSTPLENSTDPISLGDFIPRFGINIKKRQVSNSNNFNNKAPKLLVFRVNKLHYKLNFLYASYKLGYF